MSPSFSTTLPLTKAFDHPNRGMGIHNEPGLEVLPTPTTRELLTKMVDLTTSTSDPDRSFVPFKNDGKDEVVLLVNNLGSCLCLKPSLD